MKKIKIGFYIFLLVAIIVGVFGGWTLMKAYAGSVEIEDPKALLFIENGVVYYQSGASDYTQITGETEIKKGDRVKTTEGAIAKIVFYDTQEVFLDENSEIKITESYIDENTPFLTKIELELKKGQVWSRLLELLHPESSFEVHADSVVATVRGTSFNFSKQDDEINIAVFENSVGVYDKNDLTDSAVLEQDDFLTYNNDLVAQIDQEKLQQDHAASGDVIAEIMPKPKKSRFQVRKLQAEDKKAKWIKNNIERDGEFKELIKRKRQTLLNQLGPLPGSKMFYLKRIGEKLSLRFANSDTEKENIRKTLDLKRLLEIEALIDNGQIQQAMLFSRRLSPDQELLLKIKRLRALDPDFSIKLKMDEQIKTYFFNILDSTEQNFLFNKINPPMPLLKQLNGNEQTADFDKQIKSIRTELADSRNKIEQLQSTRKILLTDLENMEENISLKTDRETLEFKENVENIRKRLFEIEKQLQDLEKGRKALLDLATNYKNEADINFDEMKQSIARLNGKIISIEKLLDNINLEIQDLSEKHGYISASDDERLNLLNVTPD